MSFHLADVTMFMSHSGGGVRRYLEQKRRWLQNNGQWRHTVVAPVDSAADTVLVPAVPLPFSKGYRFVLNRSACARILEKLSPDIIETGDPYRLAWASLDAAETLHVPAVAFCHSNVEEMAKSTLGKFASLSVRRYLTRLYNRFDLVLTPSQWMRHCLLDAGVTRVLHQPLGVDTRAFHPMRRDPDWRASLGLPDDAKVLIYVGRFSTEKHLDTLCDAVRRLGAPYHLVLFGAGPLIPAGERVVVRDFEPDARVLARALASADAFVHGGDQETFGLAALEALACATPLVARNRAGLGELVSDKLGAVVGGGTSADFADAIRDLFSRMRTGDGELRRNARRRAESQEWRNVLPQLTNRYQRLLTKTRETRNGHRIGVSP